MSARNIQYSRHLALRLKLRGIPHTLPRLVYQSAKRRFLDRATGLRIAVRTAPLRGKRREIAVVYEEKNGKVLLITIHPLKVHQVKNRVESGRWQLVEGADVP
jgi:hypothetical protein